MLPWLALALVLATTSTALCAEPETPSDTWQIKGRVIDAQGKPVDDFVAATFWSSNGICWDETGKRFEIHGAADSGKIWKDEGILAADPRFPAKRVANGQFVATIEDEPRVSVFATDRQQKRGGYATVEKSAADKPVTITLLPLVRVHGRIYCPQAGRTPDWTVAIPHPPGDHENYLHFTNCGSLKGEFSFLLPPGKYDFSVYSESPDARMPKLAAGEKEAPADMPAWLDGIRVEVPSDKNSLDLGVLNVVIAKGKGDYSSYYGKQPPALEITDARGISKDVKLADLRGKWVLLDFWSLECGPCLHTSLPDLTQLYEKHAEDRARFEILSICVTREANIKTVAEFEAVERPLVGTAWHGKPLPYPVLIDGEGKTFDAYGIAGYPKTLLIDPDGHLVRWGDEAMLEEKLKAK